MLPALNPRTNELNDFARGASALNRLARCRLQDSNMDILARLYDDIDGSRRANRIGLIATECVVLLPGDGLGGELFEIK